MIATGRADLLSHWINERYAIKQRKEAGVPPPWSTDKHMTGVRYCNVHREDDKVTKYIRNSGIYSGPDVPVWHVVLARMVNRIETLEAIAAHWEFHGDFDLSRPKWKLKTMRLEGPIWGNAYTISTCGKPMDKVDYVLDHVVAAVRRKEELNVPFHTCQLTFDWLTSIDGLGSFLAAQVVADLKNTYGHPLYAAPDWWTWSAPGPGSLRGLTAYYQKPITPLFYQYAIRRAYHEVQPLLMPYIPRIGMQDFQNCLCEFSKYMRQIEGDGRARNSYVAR